MEDKKQLPNATAVLVLGIVSIVTSFAGIGLICGILGLVLAKKDRQRYMADTNVWLGYQNLNAGWIMSIIGTCLGGLGLVYIGFIIWWFNRMMEFIPQQHHHFGY